MAKTNEQEMLDQMSDLRQVYKYTFIESIEKCEEMVLEIEKNEDFELAQKLKGIIHTLKGSCGSYMLNELSQSFHLYEDQIFSLNTTNLNEFAQNSLIFFEKLTKYAESNFSESNKVHFNDVFLKRKDTSKEEIKILITESSPTVIKILKDSLSALRVTFATAEDGIVAIERVLTQKFDLLITGTQLEYFDGQSLIQTIKVSNNINSQIPCILITSRNVENKYEELLPDLIVSKDKQIGHKIVEFCSNIYPKTIIDDKAHTA